MSRRVPQAHSNTRRGTDIDRKKEENLAAVFVVQDVANNLARGKARMSGDGKTAVCGLSQAYSSNAKR